MAAAARASYKAPAAPAPTPPPVERHRSQAAAAASSAPPAGEEAPRAELSAIDLALRKNIEDQLERLISQLEDLEGLRDELTDEEYDATKADTLAQLQEFQASLDKSSQGNMTLQSELDATRLALRSAISGAFKTPEVIRMFANKQPAALRRRLAEVDRDVKLGKISFEDVAVQASEILVALKKLGESLSAKEESFLQAHMSQTLSAFEEVEDAESVSRLPPTM